jgi:hypothetical protein
MLKQGKSGMDNPQNLIVENSNCSNLSSPMFILCATCYWCATFFDKTRIPVEGNCPICIANDNTKLSIFSITRSKHSCLDDNKIRSDILKPIQNDNQVM